MSMLSTQFSAGRAARRPSGRGLTLAILALGATLAARFTGGVDSTFALARRASVLAGSGALLGLLPAAAWSDETPRPMTPSKDMFTLLLPSREWKVKSEVQQAIRMRKERVFEALEPSIKGRVVLTRTPLGADWRESEFREDLLELAGAFDRQGTQTLSKEEIVRIITKSFDDIKGRRARQWLSVERRPEISEYLDSAGQRYVRFAYDTEECSGSVVADGRPDGTVLEDCDGRRYPPTRHYMTAMVQPTKYTSMRMGYLEGAKGPMSRNIESLWLMDVSAPVSKVKKGNLDADLQKIANSLEVTLPALQLE